MASFLIWLAESSLGQALLKIIVDDVEAFIAQKKLAIAQKTQALKDAQSSIKPLQDAKDGKAVDAATHSALDKL